MPIDGDGHPQEDAAEQELPPVEVPIRSHRNDGYRLIGDPEVPPETGSDRLVQAVTEGGAAITEARTTTGYNDDGLPAGGNSLWWPDRTAQVVQATFVQPMKVGGFLLARTGEPHVRLRIIDVENPAPDQFRANAQLRLRRAGWRRVTITAYATPSGNLTVIEMLPRRGWMPQTKRYLASGVPAISALIGELENMSIEHR